MTCNVCNHARKSIEDGGIGMKYEFSGEVSAALTELSDTLRTPKSEVLRTALSVLMYVVDKLQGTSKSLAIVNAENGVVTIEILINVPGLAGKGK